MTTSVKGKRFCFTGTMKYTRAAIERKLREQGGICEKSVPSAQYLVVGTRPGAKKLKDQRNYDHWCKKITENEFLVMLGERVEIKAVNGYGLVEQLETNAIDAVQKDERIELFMKHMEEVLISSTDLAEDVIHEYVARAEAKTILKLHREGKSNG